MICERKEEGHQSGKALPVEQIKSVCRITASSAQKENVFALNITGLKATWLQAPSQVCAKHIHNTEVLCGTNTKHQTGRHGEVAGEDSACHEHVLRRLRMKRSRGGERVTAVLAAAFHDTLLLLLSSEGHTGRSTRGEGTGNGEHRGGRRSYVPQFFKKSDPETSVGSCSSVSLLRSFDSEARQPLVPSWVPRLTIFFTDLGPPYTTALA